MVMMTLPSALPEPTPTRLTTMGTAATHSTSPSVLAVVEMNLEEFPAFRLGRRSRRTELRYVRSRPAADGQVLEQTWTVRGAEGLGLPGPFEQDLYVGLMLLFTEQGLPDDGRIRFTRNRLAQVLGISNSGRGYELIEQGLARLAGATVQTEHLFVRPSPLGPRRERTGPIERMSLTFHVLEEVRVYERAAVATARRIAALDADDEEAGLAGRIEPARPFEVSVARLGAPLVQGFERRYTKGLDTTFYFQLGGPLSRRLYRYLDKVRNGRGSFEIGLRSLGDVIGLEYRYPSDIKVGLAESHDELRASGYLAGVQYLPMAGGPGAGEKVAYAFDPAFDSRPRRRAGSTGPLPGVIEASRTAPTSLAPVDADATPIPDASLMPDAPVTHETSSVPAGSVLARIDAQEATSPTSEAVTSIRIGHPNAVGASVPESVPEVDDEASARVATLESFGVTSARARQFVMTYPGPHIDAQVAALRDRIERAKSGHGRTTAPRNPAGYLAQSIIDGFATPAARPLPLATSRNVDAQSARPAPTTAAEPPRLATSTLPSMPAVEAPRTSVPALPDGPPEFVAICTALRDALSAATFSAWVATILPADGTEADEDAPDEGDTRPVVVVRVPTRFAMARWDRDPLAGALRGAEANLGVRVRLVLA
jgi:hypothetical protein